MTSFAIASVLASAQLGASCVDGVTPDCSDRAACSPTTNLDAAQESSVVTPEATTTTDAGTKSDADSGEAGDAADGG
jgi:hypothetical protein